MSLGKPKTIRQIMRKAHDTATQKGWWVALDGSGQRSLAESIALIHSELSEALEEHRRGSKHIAIEFSPSADPIADPHKPVGVAIELADAVIRIADTCQRFGIPLAEAIEIKLKYNKKRPGYRPKPPHNDHPPENP